MTEDPAKHPRGANPANTGQYSVRGFADAPGVSLTRPQQITADDLIDAYAYYRNAEDASQARLVPDGHPDIHREEAQAWIAAHNAREKTLASIHDWASEQAGEWSDYAGVEYEQSYVRAAHDVLEMINDGEPANPLVTARQAVAALSVKDRADLVKQFIADDAQAYAYSEDFEKFYASPAPYPEGLPDPRVEFVWAEGDSPDMVLQYGDDEEDFVTVTRGGFDGTQVLWGTDCESSPHGPTQLDSSQLSVLETFAVTAYERGMGVNDRPDWQAFEATQELMGRVAAQRKTN